MSLTDIMSDAGLSSYTEIAMVIFLAVFVAISIYIFSRKKSSNWDKAKQMPLDDDIPQTPRRADS